MITIIAIIAVILFPVFVRARESARAIPRLPNPKQSGLGYMQYLPDYDGIYPQQIADKTEKILMNEQSPQIAAVAEIGGKKLEAPCRVVNARLGVLYRDPQSGRTNLALNSCTPGQGSALLIDYTADKSTVIPFPVGAGGWDLIQTAPDTMIFESLGPLYLVPVDLKTRALAKDRKAVPGNKYAWRFSLAPDGWVYMGSYPTAHLYRYQPQTSEVQDLGLMGPEGNLYNRHVGATSDGWVLSSMMLAKSCVVAYNPQTKEQYIVGDAEESGKTDAPALNSIGGVVYAKLHDELQQFDSTQRKFVPAKLPPAPGGAKWMSILPTSTPERKIVRASDDVYYLLEGDKNPRPVWNLDLRGGSLIGMDENQRLVGFRGQDYFVAAPLATEITPVQIAKNPPPPVGVHFLRADPRGGVTGGPSFGQTLFRFDPARNLAENTPQVLDSGGEVYDGRWIDGKFYFVSYSGGDVAMWDPAQSWDQWNGKNPRVLHTYHDAADGELIRPIGGLVVGPRGRLYSGWSGRYGQQSGGLGEYDLKTNQSRSWKNDLFAPEMAIGSIAADDRYIYGVTSNSFSGITPPAKPITFWAFDPSAEKVVFKAALENATGNIKVLRVPGTNHIWLAAPDGLRRFDPQKLSWAQTVAWPDGVDAPAGANVADTHGNRAWFPVGSVMVRLDDGDAPSAKAVFKAPQAIGAIAAGEDEQLFFMQGVDMWSAPQ